LQAARLQKKAQFLCCLFPPPWQIATFRGRQVKMLKNNVNAVVLENEDKIYLS